MKLFPDFKADQHQFYFFGKLIALAANCNCYVKFPVHPSFIDLVFKRKVRLKDIDHQLNISIQNKNEICEYVDFICPWKNVFLTDDQQDPFATEENVDEFLRILDVISIGLTIQSFCKEFEKGFNEILDWKKFHVFSSVEFIKFFSGTIDYDFHFLTYKEFRNYIIFDNSVIENSSIIRYLFNFLRKLNWNECSRFVLF
jgi:hypothetical protein